MKKWMLLLTVWTGILLFGTEAYAGQLIYDGVGHYYAYDENTYHVGWLQLGDDWYYFEENGYARHGWVTEDGKDYFLSYLDSKMVVDLTFTIDGVICRFDSDGVCTRLPGDYEGWMKNEVTWYYRLSDGTFLGDGWHLIDDTWYYFDDEEYMVTGMITDGGETYYLDEDGAMVHDVSLTFDDMIYTFGSSGALIKKEKVWPYKEIAVDIPDEEKSDLRKTVDGMADSILSAITNSTMNRRQKAEAIYAWVRGNFRYTGHSATRDWVEEAYQGFRKRHGDCYTYFSVSQALLIRAGIPCIEVCRSTDNDHWWNLVQSDSGNWYHFDTTPRRLGGYFCMWTDQQMHDYSVSHGNCFEFDRSLYPPTP